MGYTVLIADSFSFDDKGIYGRSFANQRTLQAILASDQVSKALVIGDPSLFASLPKELFAKICPLDNALALDRAFTSGEVKAVFCSDFVTSYADWIFLRNQRASTAPVFGLTHSLSYQRFTAAGFRILTAGASTADAILCTTKSAEGVMEQLFDLVAAQLQRPGNRPSLYPFPLPLDPTIAESSPKDKPENPFQVLYLGRIDWQTKSDLLPLASVMREITSLGRFIIAGSVDNQSYAELVQRLLGQQGAEVIGNIDEQRKQELLAQSHVLISPADNYQETFGLSVIEAMAAGCVPVVSDFNGYRNLLEDGKNGFLIPTIAAPLPERTRVMQGLVSEATYHGWWAAGVCWQPQDFLDRLTLLSQDRQRWRDMSRAARQRSRYFTVEECSRRVELLLERTLDNIPEEQDYPFCWKVEKLFAGYPTSWWKEQRVALTETGEVFLKKPWPLPQMGLLSGFCDEEQLRRLLLWIRGGRDIQECLGMGAQAILFSVALKNSLIGPA